MELKNNCVKVGFSTILWTVMAILLCAAPCMGTLVGSGEILDIDSTNSPYSGPLYVYGTLNMYSGAYVDSWIYAYPGAEVDAPGGTVNVYGCAPGNTLMVLEQSTIWPGLQPVVTVYGTKFRIGTGDAFLPPADLPIPSDTLYVLSESGNVLFSLWVMSEIAIHLRAPDTGPILMDIDVKPGSYPNSINLGSHGVIPVAILSTADFDATTLNAENIFLAGSGVRVRGKGNKYLAHEEDVNGDGRPDLVVKVETENLKPDQFQDGGAFLRVHETSDDTSPVLYEGWDEIRIVPPE